MLFMLLEGFYLCLKLFLMGYLNLLGEVPLGEVLLEPRLR
eukprot:COSAG06_NODE_70847_length_189_cov_626.233333_1_plen_39_part_10